MKQILSQGELDALLTAFDDGDESDNEGDEIPPEPPPQRPQAPGGGEPPSSGYRSSRPAPNEPPDEENLELLLNLPLTAWVELGRTRMTIYQMVQLGQGSVIELNRSAEEPLDLTINGNSLAKGEAVVIEENFGFRVLELDSVKERIKKL